MSLERLDKLALLTPRELEIFKLLLKGHTLKEIASILNIGYFTVNDHYKKIYEKLGVKRRAELLIKYERE